MTPISEIEITGDRRVTSCLGCQKVVTCRTLPYCVPNNYAPISVFLNNFKSWYKR